MSGRGSCDPSITKCVDTLGDVWPYALLLVVVTFAPLAWFWWTTRRR